MLFTVDGFYKRYYFITPCIPVGPLLGYVNLGIGSNRALFTECPSPTVHVTTWQQATELLSPGR